MRNIILIATLLSGIVATPLPIAQGPEDGPEASDKAASSGDVAGPPAPEDMAGPADAQTTPAVDGGANGPAPAGEGECPDDHGT